MNAVNPRVVVTEIHKRGGMSAEQYDAFLEHSKTTHPLGRVGQAAGGCGTDLVPGIRSCVVDNRRYVFNRRWSCFDVCSID